jgi:cytochrome P450
MAIVDLAKKLPTVQTRFHAMLYPPRVVPPPRAPGAAMFAVNLALNPLRSIPEAVYDRDFVAYDSPRIPLVWITGPDLIKTVMLDARSDFSKQGQRQVLGPLLGNGILTADGQDWKWQRQTAAPIFRHQDLMALIPPMVHATENYVSKLSRDPTGEKRAVDADITRVTFDVISATLLPGGNREMETVIEQSAGRFRISTGLPQMLALANIPAWVPRPGAKTGKQSIRRLRSSVLSHIAKRRAVAFKPDDLMQRLMAARNPDTGEAMSDEQLVDNLLTFYLAGHETTAKALTWTLYLLSRAPDWDARILGEVQHVLGGGPVTAENVGELTLTQQVLKEAMRLYPPAPLFGRTALEDVMLGSHHVKAGTRVIIPIYAIQRHRRYRTDPDRFDPTRSEPAKERAIPRYHYMPFGAGPRICIGMAFAMIEATALRQLTGINRSPSPG